MVSVFARNQLEPDIFTKLLNDNCKPTRREMWIYCNICLYSLKLDWALPPSLAGLALPKVAQEARGATHERRAILIPSHALLVRSQVRKLNGASVAASALAITTCLVKSLNPASRPDIYGVLCHVCLGDGYHTSSCTTPARTNHMAGSAREPERQSICTSDTWRHRDSTEPELATSCLPPLRLGGAHDAHDPLPSHF